MSRLRRDTVKIGPLAKWVVKRNAKTGKIVRDDEGRAVYVEKLKPKGLAVLAEFMAAYDPVMKLYVSKKGRQYWAMRREGFTDEEVDSFCMAGAVVAATKFDPSRGCEFSTVALEWMWAECSRELHRRRKAKNKGVWVSSFDGDEDAPIDPPDDTEHDEATADEISHARSRVHNAMFSVLSKTEREVIRSRFGIGWEEAATLDETKVRCGLDVVKERVRQIQQVALSKLRVALTERELVQS